MAVPKLKYSIGNAASTTLSSSVTGSDTSFPLTSSTNFQAKSGEGAVLMDEGAATEEIGYSTGLSGGSLTIPLANRGLEGGSAQGHASQISVKGILSAGMWNDLIDSLINVLSQSTGALDTTKVVDLTTVQKLTNKRKKRRVVTTTQSATPTINTDNTDIAQITGLAQAVTSFTTNLSGTPDDGDFLEIQITDNGTARALTFGSSFEASGNFALPTTTVISTKLCILFEYNSASSKWRCVGVA